MWEVFLPDGLNDPMDSDDFGSILNHKHIQQCQVTFLKEIDIEAFQEGVGQ